MKIFLKRTKQEKLLFVVFADGIFFIGRRIKSYNNLFNSQKENFTLYNWDQISILLLRSF